MQEEFCSFPGEEFNLFYLLYFFDCVGSKYSRIVIISQIQLINSIELLDINFYWQNTLNHIALNYESER